MKTAFLCFCSCLLISFAARAQFPDAGSKGFAFGIAGTSGLNLNAGRTGTLLYEYYKTNDIVWRFSGSLTLGGSSSTATTSGTSTQTSNSNYGVSAGLGFQKNLARINRFAIYAGADLVPSFAYSTTTTILTITDSTNAGTGLNGDYVKNVFNKPVIFTLGIYPLVGFNFFISKNFAIGAEFGMGVAYSFPGTGSQVNTQRSYNVNLPTSTSPYAKTGSAFNFTSASAPVITGSVFF